MNTHEKIEVCHYGATRVAVKVFNSTGERNAVWFRREVGLLAFSQACTVYFYRV